MDSDNIDLKALQARAKKAFERNDLWESLLEDAYDYFLPNRNIFNRDDKGQNKMDLIYDSTAIVAIQQGASKLQENIAPIWQRWAIHDIAEELKKQAEENDEEYNEEEIKATLEQQSEIIFDYINRSNFATQFYEMALDLLIGTGTLSVKEVPGDEVISFHCVPQKHVAFEEGPHGNIETHWRKHKVEARNLERTWAGFTPSPTVQKIINDSPNDMISCTEGIVYVPETATYYGVVWVENEDKISWFFDYQGFSQFVTGRYSKTAGEIRGRGPALQVLPDVKSLNKAKEFILQKAAIDLAGMWTATDDGVTNPYTVTISPGVVIPVGSNNSSNPSISRLDTSTNIELSLFEIQELQNHIKISLFNDLRDPTGPVRTATEIAMEARDLAKRIGSAYGRLQTEVLIPILKAVTLILIRRGKIKPILLDGKAVDIKFTSPLAVAQDMEDLMAAQHAIEFTLNTVGPEMVKVAFKHEEIGAWAGKKTGMPADLIRNKADRDQAIAAGAKVANEQLNQGHKVQPES